MGAESPFSFGNICTYLNAVYLRYLNAVMLRYLYRNRRIMNCETTSESGENC